MKNLWEEVLIIMLLTNNYYQKKFQDRQGSTALEILVIIKL